jgi:NAD+ kinase
MTSTPGSTPPRAEPLRRAAVVTHGRRETIGAALERVQRIARDHGVELLYAEDEARKHGVASGEEEHGRPELAVVLGGDGTMLRALERFLGTGVPVLGVNFGRVGFLTSLTPDGLEDGLARVFRGEYTVSELPTLDAQTDGGRWTAVNDVVCTSSSLGRMVLLGWAVGDEHLGEQACDGVICSTPSGSTAYNLSNGGPVLVWGLDALAVTFVAPHSLHARPLVVPRGRDVTIRNETPDVAFTLLVDGHRAREVEPGGEVAIRLGDQKTLLASLPEVTFFRRYRDTFGS